MNDVQKRWSIVFSLNYQDRHPGVLGKFVHMKKSLPFCPGNPKPGLPCTPGLPAAPGGPGGPSGPGRLGRGTPVESDRSQSEK